MTEVTAPRIVHRFAVVSDKGWLFDHGDGVYTWGSPIGDCALYGSKIEADMIAASFDFPARSHRVLVDLEPQ